MSLNSLDELLSEQLQDLYSAEKQLIDALPKLASAAKSPRLRKAFEDHLEETKLQKERLERAFTELGIKKNGHTCKAMKGLIEEGEELLKKRGIDKDVRDAGLIAAAQRVEHYEIAAYGCARAYADRMGKQTVAKLLDETLIEEKEADQKLNIIALDEVNAKADET
jgi:ferritin-like metal-binding protein YciE